MGVPTNTQTEDEPYLDAVENQIHLMSARGFRPWLFSKFIFDWSSWGAQQRKNLVILHGFVNQLICKKETMMADNAKMVNIPTQMEDQPEKIPSKKPFLEQLLNVHYNDPKFTRKDLESETAFMIAAGYETSMVTFTHVLLCLAQNQEIQDRVFEELFEVFGDTDRPIELTDLPNLHYLEMVIKETLRILPAIGYTVRHTLDDISLDDYIIPKSTLVTVSFLTIHRNEATWPDPLRFDPDRFLPEETAKRHPFSYIPFSGGARNCIAYRYVMMSMKTLISTVLRSYRVFTDLRFEELKYLLEISLKIDGGVFLRLEHRNKREKTF